MKFTVLDVRLGSCAFLFASRLASVDIFIASHHGRENGYCEELFAQYDGRPDVFVFSDSPIQHATQEMTTA